MSKKINDKNLENFILKKIEYNFFEYKKDLVGAIKKKKLSYKKKFPANEIIVSPSDFGLHNIIKKDKKLFFFDFEYAGLDDPVKLVMDFYCHPNTKLTNIKLNKLKREIFNNNSNLYFRYNMLIKLNFIKWSCVIMNKVLNNRIHRKGDFNSVLKKSYNYFKANLDVK